MSKTRKERRDVEMPCKDKRKKRRKRLKTWEREYKKPGRPEFY